VAEVIVLDVVVKKLVNSTFVGHDIADATSPAVNGWGADAPGKVSPSHRPLIPLALVIKAPLAMPQPLAVLFFIMMKPAMAGQSMRLSKSARKLEVCCTQIESGGIRSTAQKCPETAERLETCQKVQLLQKDHYSLVLRIKRELEPSLVRGGSPSLRLAALDSSLVP